MIKTKEKNLAIFFGNLVLQALGLIETFFFFGCSYIPRLSCYSKDVGIVKH